MKQWNVAIGMQRSTLVVDDDEPRRRALVHALSRRGLRFLDVADAFGAMAALGRADFGAVVATEGRRTLSLRGLCQLARRRHPDVVILVIHREGSDPAQIPQILGTKVDVISPKSTPDDVAAAVENALLAPISEDVSVEFATVPITNVTEKTVPNARQPAPVDEDPTIKMPIASLPQGRARAPGPAPISHGGAAPVLPQMPAPLPTIPSLPTLVAPDSLAPDEPTERVERANLSGSPAAIAAITAAPSPLAGLATNATHPNVPQPITMPSNPSTEGPSQVQLASQISTEEGPLLEGLLDGGSGPALLLGVFTQELTGRLVVKDGPAAGTLYFYRGEPVWADDPLGDAGLHRRLVHKGRLRPDAQIEAVAQGQLLGSLVQKGLLTGQQMHDFMRELVRDFVLGLSGATSGAYRFEEDRKFLDVAPLLRVNPFGLVLESRRKQMSPAQLLQLSSEMENKYVIAGPGLGTSSDKLAPFVRGARLDHVIDGTKTVRQVLEYTSLDQFMGTLVMLSLKDTKLVSLSDEPRPIQGGVTLNENATLGDNVDDNAVTVVDAEFPTEPPQSEEEAKAREAIFGLYMRLKPLTVPRQVLGVGLDADLAEIEAAYKLRMDELDPTRIPEGSAQQLMSARVDELRKKVTSAYQALKLQTAPGTEVGAPFSASKSPKTNPF